MDTVIHIIQSFVDGSAVGGDLLFGRLLIINISDEMKPQANNAFSGFQALFTLIRFALQLVHHALPAPYNAVLANYVVANSGV